MAIATDIMSSTFLKKLFVFSLSKLKLKYFFLIKIFKFSKNFINCVLKTSFVAYASS